MFYVENKGNRWARMAVSYPTREKAIDAAKLGADEGVLIVYDCTRSPVGIVIAKYSADGQPLT